jgi:hypothetical protein
LDILHSGDAWNYRLKKEMWDDWQNGNFAGAGGRLNSGAAPGRM